MLLATAVTPAPGPAPATRDVVPLLLGGCDLGSPINVRPGRVTCVWCGGPTRQPCPRPRPRRLPCPRPADLACVPCVPPASASGEHPMSAGHSGRGGRGLCPPARLPRVDLGHLPRLPPPHQPRAARPRPPGTRPCRPQALARIGPTAPGSRRGSCLSGGSCFPGPGFLLEAPRSWGRWAPAGARPLLRGGVLRVLGRPGPGPPQRGCLHVTPGHPGTVKQHGLGAGSGSLSSGGLWGAGHHNML